MLHFDTGKIGNYEETDEGFLRIFGTIAKVGWLDYINQDGTIRKEYVSEETLFDSKHLDSIGGAVLTLGHPPEMVNPDNYSKYAVGATGTKIIANIPKPAIDVVFIVNDSSAIKAIKEDGIRELSMGYRCEVQEKEDGTLCQLNRICNHNAIVKEARCRGAKLRLDGWYQSDSNDLVLPEKPEKKMISQYRTVYYSRFN